MRWIVLLSFACATAPRPTRVSLAVTDASAQAALAEALQRAGLQPSTAGADYVVTGAAVSQSRHGHTCMTALKLEVKDAATGKVVGAPSVNEPGGGRDEQACALDGAKRAAASIAPRLVELISGGASRPAK